MDKGLSAVVIENGDRFGRRTKLRWNRSLPSGNVTLLNMHYGYDWDSYMTSTDDKVMDGYDEQLTIDGLGRIQTYERGLQTAGGFTDRSYRMDRTFDSLGNMTTITVDRNGDGMYTGTGESSESRTFNDAGEIVARTSLDPSVGDPTWFADGAMDSSGEGQHSTYDAWGNLVRVEVDGTNALVLALRRDALNRIIAQHADETGDGLANGSDTIYTYLPDSSGRPLAAFKQGETIPRLERLFAGPEFLTGSRESRDDNSDGVRDRVTYVLPDATGSAAGFFDLSTGEMERVHYNPMGVPTCLPSGDINGDGKTDADDYVLLRLDVANQTYDDKSDLNADGLVDVWDAVDYEPKIGGTGVLSLTGNTLGLHQMPRANASYLAGARTFSESLGRWTSKDPSGYVDGPSLYQGMRGNVFSFVDRGGRTSVGAGQGGGGSTPGYNEKWKRGSGVNTPGGDRGAPGLRGYFGPGFSIGTNAPVQGTSFVNHAMSDGYGGYPGIMTGCISSICFPCVFSLIMRLDINEVSPGPNGRGFAELWHGPDLDPLKDPQTGETPIGWTVTGRGATARSTGVSDSVRDFTIALIVPCGTSKIIQFAMASTHSDATASFSVHFTCGDCEGPPRRSGGASSAPAPVRPPVPGQTGSRKGTEIAGPTTPTGPGGTPQGPYGGGPSTPIRPPVTPGPEPALVPEPDGPKTHSRSDWPLGKGEEAQD